jgi:uncharacterized PurR-regulated membrane protein YhhQ (DUF165 family)
VNRRALVLFGAFAATIPLANWTLAAVGFVNVPLLGPVASGVVWVGLAFVLRDMAQAASTKWATLPAVAVGVALSAWLASPALALASAAAFGVSETLDWAIYTALADRRWTLAVILSSVIGGAVDSALFLSIAFGSATGWWQLAIVKAAVIAATIPIARRCCSSPVS